MVALAAEHADHNNGNDNNEQCGHHRYDEVQIGQDDADGFFRAQFG